MEFFENSDIEVESSDEDEDYVPPEEEPETSDDELDMDEEVMEALRNPETEYKSKDGIEYSSEPLPLSRPGSSMNHAERRKGICVFCSYFLLFVVLLLLLLL